MYNQKNVRMKNLIFTISLLFITTVAFSQMNCKKFKTGRFHNIENGVIKTKISRSKTIQIEEWGESKIKLKIVWINDCSYRLIFLEGNDAWWGSVERDAPTPDAIVRITNVDGNSYLQESKFADEEEFIYKSIIEKIE